MEKSAKKQRIAKGQERVHLPEWNEVFGELKEEANARFPDGRVRVVIPEEEEDDEAAHG